MQDLSNEQKDNMKTEYLLKFRAMADDLTLFLNSPDESISILRQVIEEQEFRKSGDISDEFYSAFQQSGTLYAHCEGCNRTHFASYEESEYAEGVLEDFIERSKTQPGLYIDHGNVSSVTTAVIGGADLVLDCDCPTVRNWERIFWNNRWQITSFYQMMAKKLRLESNDASTVANNAKRALVE